MHNQAMSMPRQQLNPGCVPLQWRTPTASIGSALHVDHHDANSDDQCKPCAWYWRHQGCMNREQCRHCHMCSQTALKAFSKRRKGMRQTNTDAQGHVATASPNTATTRARTLMVAGTKGKELDEDMVVTVSQPLPPPPGLEGIALQLPRAWTTTSFLDMMD